FKGLPPPDLILITHEHPDHMSADTLNAIGGSKAPIVAPESVRDKLPQALAERVTVMKNGESETVADIAIEAVPAYNTTPDRLKYHPRGRDNGYLLTLGNRRVYIAGDTEDTPEMRALRNIDVAFVPMNLPYTMTVQQAADAVRAFKPRIVYPYHSRGSDVDEFARLVGKDSGIEVRLRNWY
ncbi:MAG TPA: MBL fold metallo-hydrolase, partial [Gammaproteobacteria bacterium]|nr:MBL fold metallo-hydrolase [Gammaproteobacteria bacterium]